MVLDGESGRIQDENWGLRDFAPFPYQSLNTDGEIITVNTAWLETLGYQLNEVKGRWFGDFLTDEYEERFESAFSEFKSAGELSSAEFKLQSADGETIFVSFQGFIEYEEDGSVHCTHCQFQDISEQKVRERQLKEREEKYRNLFNDTRDALIIFDREGPIDCNEQTLDLFGFDTIEEFLDYSPWELSPPEQPDGRDSEAAAKKHIETAYEEGEAFFEWTNQQVDGTEFFAEVKLSRFDYGGESVLLSLTRDITERKARERKLRELKERYQSFVEYSSDIITVTDSEGAITYQSPAVKEVFGYEPDDMVGDNVFGYIHPDDRQVSVNKIQNLANQDEESTETIEHRFEHTDGSYRWLESIGVDQTDSPIDGIVFYSRDISERKADEEKLKQRNEQLDRFASIVSHDLRNPLNVAFARLELAQEECETPEHERIEMALGRIRGIIDDTLTLSRMGETVDDTQKMDLRARITQCWDAVETGSSELESLAETTHIWADPDRFRHVLENLFRNAVEHGGDGVTVSVELLEDGFAVSDDGPGLPDEVDIFETGQTTSEVGTGFGLTIVKEIVSAHGWEAQATETDTGGARFEITGVEFATE